MPPAERVGDLAAGPLQRRLGRAALGMRARRIGPAPKRLRQRRAGFGQDGRGRGMVEIDAGGAHLHLVIAS